MKKALLERARITGLLCAVTIAAAVVVARPAARPVDRAAVQSQVDARMHALLARMAKDAQDKAGRLALADER